SVSTQTVLITACSLVLTLLRTPAGAQADPIPNTEPAQEAKQKPGDEELRGRCHAHFFFTAALHEDDDKTRLALLNKAIEQDAKLARAFYNRGNIYARQDKLDLAKADFQKAAALKDDYIHAHYNLACILSLQSRPDEALASLEQALAKGYQ